MNRVTLAATLVTLSMPAMAVSQQLGFHGISPVHVGMTVAEAENVLHAKLTPEMPWDSDSTECAIFIIKGRVQPVSYMVERGLITRADLAGRNVKSRIKTANGIGLGSSIAQINRAYGTQGKWHPNFYTAEPVFEITSADGQSAILFETERGRVVSIHTGRLPSVEYVEGCQ